jgi:xanthine dehydrogenase accessory factor
MKEINRMLAVYEQVDHSQRKVALATVVYVEGSAYRRPGARMWVTDDGRWEGAISGGSLEGDALRKAGLVMLDRQPRLVRYDTMDDDANSLGVGLGCNGIIDVLIETIEPSDPINPLFILQEFVEQRDRRVIATVFHTTDRNPDDSHGRGLWLKSVWTLPHGSSADLEEGQSADQTDL